MDRRTLFKRGLLGGAILSVFGGGFLGLRQGQYDEQSAGTLDVLDATAFAVLVAAARRIIDVDEAEAKRLVKNVDAALTYGPAAARSDFVQVLHLLENGFAGVFFRGSPRLFTELDEAGQVGALYAWRDSRLTLLRGAYHGIRRLVLGTHYAQLENAKTIGYPGPIFEKPYAGDIEARAPLSPPYVKRPILEQATPPPAPGQAPIPPGAPEVTP